MRGTRLDFSKPTGPVFNFGKVLVDFACTVQNALVNVATDDGSDPLYAGRGTTLKKDGAEGKMVNAVWATHAANFAALRTLAFVQQTEVQSNAFKLQNLTLRCRQLSAQLVAMDIQAVCVDGTVIGQIAQT